MGSVIHFEERAVASLRQRLGAAESANEDLIAFARGHSGAVSAIHRAVLSAIAADSIEELLGTVTRDWPVILRIDAVAFALVVGEAGYRADAAGIAFIAPQLIDKALAGLGEVELRAVPRGHSLFGNAASDIRAEALIRIDCGEGLPHGLLALGQRDVHDIDAGHGAALLRFLGQSLAAMIARWLTIPTD
ncbi:MAG: DUF484 family protein [Sphingomicrobium sp.]